MLTNANFGTQVCRLYIATKLSRVDLNTVILELTLLVLSHKYTLQNMFDSIHSKQYLNVPDLPDMLEKKEEGQELVGFTFCVIRHVVYLSVRLSV